MSNLASILEEEYKKKDRQITPESLLSMVQEVMSLSAPGTLKEISGARARERVLRLPNVIPTEITVGQKPSSADRAQFELWMGNIGMEGGSDDSAVAQKLKAITSFFENPEANLADATIPQTLSY